MTGNTHSTCHPVDSATIRIPVPHPRPRTVGTPQSAGRHHADPTTPLERHAWHMARHILDDPESYQRLARRVPASLGGAA